MFTAWSMAAWRLSTPEADEGRRRRPISPGDGVGDHVTDHHPVAALLQALQSVAHLSSVVHGEDVEVEVQQAAQGVGRLGDGGEAHDGVEAGIILGQLHGAQHVVHRDVDVHHAGQSPAG